MKYTLFIPFLFIIFCGHAQVLKPTDKEALIKVFMHNPAKALLKTETVIFESVKTKKKYSGITDEAGKLPLLVPKGDDYLVEYKTLLESEEYNKIEIPNEEAMLTMNVEIEIDPPKTYTLKDVFFDTGKSTLKPQSFTALNELVEVMKMKTTMVIEIAGHTDNVGDHIANQKLSEGRANAVFEYLIKHGIPPARVSARGYGETVPVADNDTDEGRQKNRRTEVRIIKE